MMPALPAILFVAVVFYVIIPGVGAFGVRRRWRMFRRRISQATLRPPVTYASVRTGSRNSASLSYAARFLGTLESIQGENIAWVRGAELTIAVDMSSSDVFLLPQAEDHGPGSPPLRTSWSRVGSLPEGLKVLVSGRLDTTGAHPLMRAENGEPVVAVFYDGPDTSLIRRCIWSGRQLNEYWNSVTPAGLAGGTLALIVLAYFLLREPLAIGYARLAVALASVPVLPLLPPGVAMFYLYRRTWRRGRTLRAHRDVLRLPLRYFTAAELCTRLPAGESYCLARVDREVIEAASAPRLTVLEPPPEVVRSPGDPQTVPREQYTVFGTPRGEILPGPPEDPLAEWIAVRGDPLAASERCQRIARRFEVGSLVILGAGMAVNLFLVLLLVVALI